MRAGLGSPFHRLWGVQICDGMSSEITRARLDGPDEVVHVDHVRTVTDRHVERFCQNVLSAGVVGDQLLCLRGGFLKVGFRRCDSRCDSEPSDGDEWLLSGPRSFVSGDEQVADLDGEPGEPLVRTERFELGLGGLGKSLLGGLLGDAHTDSDVRPADALGSGRQYDMLDEVVADLAQVLANHHGVGDAVAKIAVGAFRALTNQSRVRPVSC
jgi:hypothetical protein